jgi:hypothetical protein
LSNSNANNSPITCSFEWTNSHANGIANTVTDTETDFEAFSISHTGPVKHAVRPNHRSS